MAYELPEPDTLAKYMYLLHVVLVPARSRLYSTDPQSQTSSMRWRTYRTRDAARGPRQSPAACCSRLRRRAGKRDRQRLGFTPASPGLLVATGASKQRREMS